MSRKHRKVGGKFIHGSACDESTGMGFGEARQALATWLARKPGIILTQRPRKYAYHQLAHPIPLGKGLEIDCHNSKIPKKCWKVYAR
jgi:hypothetical protein